MTRPQVTRPMHTLPWISLCSEIDSQPPSSAGRGVGPTDPTEQEMRERMELPIAASRRLQFLSKSLAAAATSAPVAVRAGTAQPTAVANTGGERRRNGGTALVAQLASEGARLVCGVPGAGQYEATDALFEHPTVRYIATRNEQAASMVADGFARVTEGVGVVLVVPGPGFYSAAGGLISAHSVHSKVLTVTGAPHYIHGASTATTQQDLDLLRPMCKWAGRAETAADIPSRVHEAFIQMGSDRPGTAVLEIPASELREELQDDGPFSELLPRPCPVSLVPAATEVTAACDILRAAARPLLWVGAGAARAAEPVRFLAEMLGCGVVSSIQGKGTLSDRHPLSLGSAELRFASLNAYVESCDVVLAVGTASSSMPKSATCVRIDVAAGGASDLYLCGDATKSLEAVVSELEGFSNDMRRTETERVVASINAERHGSKEQIEPQAGYMAAIRASLPDDAVVISGMNQMGYYCRSYLQCYQPRTLLTLTPHITLGSEYPLALGAKLGVDQRASDNAYASRGNTPVVSVCGDGGFAYSIGELSTAVQYGISVIVIVFNDNAYGNVKRAQETDFGGRVIGTTLEGNPDFVALAQAFGVRAARVPLAEGSDEFGSAEGLQALLEIAVAEQKPWLIEVPVGPMERAY